MNPLHQSVLTDDNAYRRNLHSSLIQPERSVHSKITLRVVSPREDEFKVNKSKRDAAAKLRIIQAIKMREGTYSQMQPSARVKKLQNHNLFNHHVVANSKSTMSHRTPQELTIYRQHNQTKR